jgi:hypothetical protein
MPTPSNPSWIHATTRRRAGYSDLRISDAERAEVADLLSKHYSDGRLDQAEFNERIDQAMKAKTYSDLSGLFADLPRTESSEAPKAFEASGALTRQPDHHPALRFLLPIVVIVIAVIVGQALLRSLLFWPMAGIFGGGWAPLLLIGLLAFLWLRHADRRR